MSMHRWRLLKVMFYCVPVLLVFITTRPAGGAEKIDVYITQVNSIVVGKNQGTIERPIDVARQNSVQGKARAVPDDKFLWVVLNPEGSLFWPQISSLQVNPRSGDWSQAFYVGPEGGDYGKRFDVMILLCDETANNVFTKWQQEGERSGNYPGIALPVGCKVLDIVSVRKSLQKEKEANKARAPR